MASWRAPKEPEEPVDPVPHEPNGKKLTQKRANLEHTFEKMQGTADAITRLLQDEQKRQRKYR